MNSAISQNVYHLISQILQTSDEKLINSSFQYAKDFITAPIMFSNPQSIKYWEKKWSSSLNPSSKERLSFVCKKLTNQKLQFFKLLNELKGTQKTAILTQRHQEKPHKQSSKIITEEEIVYDLLSMLQCGSGNKISIKNGQITVNGSISPTHRFISSQILRLVYCVNLINKSTSKLKGIFGQALRAEINKELQNFVTAIAVSQTTSTTLLSLNSFINGEKSERISATAFICHNLQQSEDYLINLFETTQSHGNPYVKSIGQNLIKSGTEIITSFIKDWVVYGFLNDPYHEFFITRNKESIESYNWWNSKFLIVPEKVPSNIVDSKLIPKIVSSGKAWNFIRKYKSISMNVETEGVFDSSHFDLFLVDKFVKLAMRNAMSIMMDYVWVPGHLRTLNDFILFFRGDFATSILSLLSNDRQSEALNVLLLSLQSVTNGSLYTNKLTGEHLLDRIDLQMKTGLDKSNVQLSYKVDSPLNFLLNPESISNYRRISQILWKLKCCEYHLSDNWKKSRQQFSFDFDSRLSRLQNTLRHLILTTIHTLNEFVSTDVILVSGRKLEDSMKNVSDIDELLELHQKHIRNLMKSTLLTDEFIEIQNAFGLILDTANKFNDLEDEIESIYDNYIDEIQNTDKFEEESEVIIQRMKNDLSDAYFQIEGLKEEFQNRVNELYELAAQGSNSLELQRLELRLLFCCENKL